MTSLDSQPFSSWATMSALITADCFLSGGYLAISRSIFFSESTESIGKTWSVPVFHCFSPVDFSEHDVLGADDRHRVGDHVAARHLVERGQVREARRADLEAVGLVRAVGHQVD